MNEIFQRINKTQMRTTLAVLIITGTLALAFILQFRDVPPSNRDIVYMAFGLWMGAVTTVVNFYFGSTKGEADKQKAELEESK